MENFAESIPARAYFDIILNMKFSHYNPTSKWLFLIGLFSLTEVRIIGSVGISELCMYPLAPIFFVLDYALLRRDGFTKALWLLLLTMVGCIVSSMVNHTPLVYALKGFATPYTMFSVIVVLHRLLRTNLKGVRWLFLGMAISSVVCVFVFQRGTEVAVRGELLSGDDAVEQITGGTLFWAQRLGAFLTLPIKGWYLHTPVVYSALEPLALSVFTMLTTISGRSMVLMSLTGVIMVVAGGRSVIKMARVSKHIFVGMITIMIAAGCLKMLYSYCAEKGLLGEAQTEKYKKQTRGGSSGWKMLLAGRSEFFICMFAGVHNPIIGLGPKAIDNNNYIDEFMANYGSQEDYEDFVAGIKNSIARGEYYERMIPAHSGIGAFWIWFGIFGLIYYLYFIFKIFHLLRRYLSAIPHWYGIFAYGIPGALWAVFFSPPERFTTALMFTLVLLAIAVGRKRLRLPIDMQREISMRS